MNVPDPHPLTALRDGTPVARLGLGTWRMGEARSERSREVAALRAGLERGMTLVDTAEMYGEGGAEEVVAEATIDCRDRVFLVSKFYPHHASARSLPRACEASLKRLRTDRIDLYLLHWRGDTPLAETVEALARLVDAGKILRWGLSNLDVDDMAELEAGGGAACATNQVLYNLSRRGIEFNLRPWCAERRMPLMAYSPVEQGRLARAPALRTIAQRLGATPAQVALAWLARSDDLIVIPKASSIEHVAENHAALQLRLDAQALQALDAAFPPPRRAQPLEMI